MSRVLGTNPALYFLLVLLVASTATCSPLKQDVDTQTNKVETLEEAEQENLAPPQESNSDIDRARADRTSDVERLMMISMLQSELQHEADMQTSAGSKIKKFFTGKVKDALTKTGSKIKDAFTKTGSKIKGFFGRVKDAFKPPKNHHSPVELQLSALLQG